MYFRVRTSLYRLAFVFALSLIFHSCGLRYTPPPSWEELRDQRRSSLERQLISDFNQVNLVPKVLLYGEPVTVKPASFIQLDSLFNLKYIAQKSGRPTNDLDRQIEVQRGKVLSDSSELLYRETVWLMCSNQERLSFIIAQTNQNNQFVLRSVKILESFDAEHVDSIWASTYFIEEPFLRSGEGITADEHNFYGYMKNYALTLSVDKRNEFLKNVFLIMRIAYEERSLSTDLILRRLAALRFVKDFPDMNRDNMSFFAEKVQIGDETQYEVTVMEKAEGNFKKIYVFDSYFYPK